MRKLSCWVGLHCYHLSNVDIEEEKHGEHKPPPSPNAPPPPDRPFRMRKHICCFCGYLKDLGG